jgi:simple sugar transport system substrate-binding protein
MYVVATAGPAIEHVIRPKGVFMIKKVLASCLLITGAFPLLIAFILLLLVPMLPSTAEASKDKKNDQSKQVIAFLYEGKKADYGYNQAHAEGAKAVQKLPGVKVLERENVPETEKAQEVIKELIEKEGATIICATSWGYFNPHLIVMARKYPEVHFVHCGGSYDAKKHPKNISTFYGYIEECEYLSGVVAGYTTKSKKIGFVAAKPIPQIHRNINAFTLGARSVDRAIKCTVYFTGDWLDATKEANAVTHLARAEVDVVACHVDSPKVVVENAVAKGMLVCGCHTSQADLAKDKYLTGAQWNFGQIYTEIIKQIQDKREPPHLLRGGLKENYAKLSPYGPAVSNEARKKADAIMAMAKEGKLVIFKGPLKNHKGKEVIPAGKEYHQQDFELERMDYLVEGVEVED